MSRTVSVACKGMFASAGLHELFSAMFHAGESMGAERRRECIDDAIPLLGKCAEALGYDLVPRPVVSAPSRGMDDLTPEREVA